MANEQAPAPARDRWAGPPERLADVLFPYVCRPNFVIYDVSRKAVLNKPEIIKHAQLIRALSRLQANWSFRQDTMTKALEIVMERREGLTMWFDNDPAQASRWPEVQSARVRMLLRHWSQSVIKSRGYHTGWVRMVQGDIGRVDPNEDGTQYADGLDAGDGQAGAMAPARAIDDGQEGALPQPGAPDAQDGDGGDLPGAGPQPPDAQNGGLVPQLHHDGDDQGAVAPPPRARDDDGPLGALPQAGAPDAPPGDGGHLPGAMPQPPDAEDGDGGHLPGAMPQPRAPDAQDGDGPLLGAVAPRAPVDDGHSTDSDEQDLASLIQVQGRGSLELSSNRPIQSWAT